MIAHWPGVTLGYNALIFPYREEAIVDAGRLGLGVVTINPLGGGVIPQHPDRFQKLCRIDGDSVVQAALRYNVSHPAITCALVGFSNPAEVDEAVTAIRDASLRGGVAPSRHPSHTPTLLRRDLPASRAFFGALRALSPKNRRSVGRARAWTRSL